MRAGEKHFLVPHEHVGLGELRPARAHRLHFPALQHQARLEALLDEVLEARLAVLGDQAFGFVGVWPCCSAVPRMARELNIVTGRRLWGRGLLVTIPRHARGQALGLVAQPPSRMFALINDIESYPAFVPGCTHARVESRDARRDRGYARRAQGADASGDHHPQHASSRTVGVHMSLVEGPFKMLEGDWTLTPVGEGGCRVDLVMRFAFKNRDVGNGVRAAVRADRRVARGRLRRAAPAPRAST